MHILILGCCFSAIQDSAGQCKQNAVNTHSDRRGVIFSACSSKTLCVVKFGVNIHILIVGGRVAMCGHVGSRVFYVSGSDQLVTYHALVFSACLRRFSIFCFRIKILTGRNIFDGYLRSAFPRPRPERIQPNVLYSISF